MSVLELCDREIAAVPLDASVADAINKMLDHHDGAVCAIHSHDSGISSSRCLARTERTSAAAIGSRSSTRGRA